METCTKEVEHLAGSSLKSQSPRKGFKLKREFVVRKEAGQGNAVEKGLSGRQILMGKWELGF